MWPESDRSPTEDQPAEKRGAGVLAEPPTPQRKLASTPAPQRDGSLSGTERKPESALFSPSPVVGQEQPPPVCSRVPETESSESDASDEPGPKEDPPHCGARPAVEMEEDPEAADIDQEEAGGAEPPSAQLELDISSLPALRDLSTGARPTVHIPWPPVGLERATPEWRRGRPRPWHSSWVDEGVNITPAGTAPCDNDQSAASMPLTSRRTEGCGPPVCTKVRSVGCWTG